MKLSYADIYQISPIYLYHLRNLISKLSTRSRISSDNLGHSMNHS